MSFFHPTPPHPVLSSPVCSFKYFFKYIIFAKFLGVFRSYGHRVLPTAVIVFEYNLSLLSLNLFVIWYLINAQGVLENFRSVSHSRTGFFWTPDSISLKGLLDSCFQKLHTHFLLSELYGANLSPETVSSIIWQKEFCECVFLKAVIAF